MQQKKDIPTTKSTSKETNATTRLPTKAPATETNATKEGLPTTKVPADAATK